MREVIARLRASKARSAEDDYQEGFEEGRGWAMTRAEAAELEDLAAWREQAGLDWELHFDRTVSDAYSPGEILVFAISPERNGDREIAREFWEGNVSSPHLSLKSEFVRGFAEGALDLWKEVSDQL